MGEPGGNHEQEPCQHERIKEFSDREVTRIERLNNPDLKGVQRIRRWICPDCNGVFEWQVPNIGQKPDYFNKPQSE